MDYRFHVDSSSIIPNSGILRTVLSLNDAVRSWDVPSGVFASSIRRREVCLPKNLPVSL